MSNSLPGFDDACRQEAWERNGAYVAPAEKVCGIDLRQITPLDLARLNYARNPFVAGGLISYPSAAQFIFIQALNPLTIEASLAHVAAIPLATLADEISAFVELTMRDQPGGSASDLPPIASLAAWLEYRMYKVAGWDRERTLNTALRIIWQQLRCWKSDQGEPVANKLSGSKDGDFLDELQKRMDAGTITQADLDKINEPWLKSRSLN